MAFEKGNQLAKGHGRPRMSETEKKLVMAKRTELKIIMAQYMSYSLKEVRELIATREEHLPVIDMMILKALVKGYESDQMVTIDWITDHVMGSRAKKVEVKNTSPINLKNLNKKQLENLKEIIESQENE